MRAKTLCATLPLGQMRGYDYMSTSDKKKLRKEAAAAKLTEKQEAERKEAKKLKTYSTIFGVVIAVMYRV